MYILTTKAKFDSAHFLKDYQGKCANIHGHRWTVVIDVSSPTVEEEGSFRGMVVDFGKLKADLKEETERLDHHMIYETGSLKETTIAALNDEGFEVVEVPFRPTAENLSKFFYELMAKKGYTVAKCSVYETPDNCATYME